MKKDRAKKKEVWSLRLDDIHYSQSHVFNIAFQINQKFSNNKTPLHSACHEGKAEIVSYLLENGADKEIRVTSIKVA
jgi:ankyrin repeat protein